MLIGKQCVVPENFSRLAIVAETLWRFRKRFFMFYAHCQAPANFYDTLFLLRHTPHFRAGFSSASSRQAKHDRNSRTVGTPHYPRPFCIQSRHANSHRRHYSCMEGKSKYIPHGKRRIEGVRHEWRFLRLHIDLFWELRRYL